VGFSSRGSSFRPERASRGLEARGKLCKTGGRLVSRVLSGAGGGLRPMAFIPLTGACAIIYLGPSVAAGLKQPTRGSNGAGSSSPLLGLAPDGGCLAGPIAGAAGGLLHHRFTLASDSHPRWSVSVALSAGFPARVLPGTLPCGARTFLGLPFTFAQDSPRSPGRPTGRFHLILRSIQRQQSTDDLETRLRLLPFWPCRPHLFGHPFGAPWVCAALGALSPGDTRRGAEGEGRGALSPGDTRPWRPVPWGHPKGCRGRRGVEGGALCRGSGKYR